MNVEDMVAILEVISGETESNKISPFIRLASQKLSDILIPGTEQSDPRLPFLCAAIANFYYQQAEAAKDKKTYTYAGAMSGKASNDSLRGAEMLYREYCRMCSDIVICSDFIFSAVSTGEEIK